MTDARRPKKRTKKKPAAKKRQGHDSVFATLPDGTRTNAFLYDEVDSVPETAAERRENRKRLIALGLTKEEAEAIS